MDKSMNVISRFLWWLKDAISESRLMQKLEENYPTTFHFFIQRFNLKIFTGFPLTLLLCLFLFNILLFSEIAEDVMNSEAIVTVDQQFTLFLFANRNPALSKCFYALTQLASQTTSIGIAVLVSIVLLIQRKKVYFFALWIVLAGVGLSVRYGKLFFQRNRPLHVAYTPETNFSFPSGHSTTAMALFGLLTYFLIRRLTNRTHRIIIGLCGGLLILLIGFSRIYLGAHFLSDVLSGFVLGFTWVLLGITSIEWLSYHRKQLHDNS